MARLSIDMLALLLLYFFILRLLTSILFDNASLFSASPTPNIPIPLVTALAPTKFHCWTSPPYNSCVSDVTRILVRTLLDNCATIRLSQPLLQVTCIALPNPSQRRFF